MFFQAVQAVGDGFSLFQSVSSISHKGLRSIGQIRILLFENTLSLNSGVVTSTKCRISYVA
jgi:hypothetical protein